jgi:hypothetical protein
MTKPKTPEAEAETAAQTGDHSEEDCATAVRWTLPEDENVLMLQAAEAGDDRIADVRHCDELNRMKSRLFGLEAAVAGASTFSKSNERNGVLQLMFDVVQQMENCAKAFGDVHDLRCANKPGEKWGNS